jgi:hypothetical protein
MANHVICVELRHSNTLLPIFLFYIFTSLHFNAGFVSLTFSLRLFLISSDLPFSLYLFTVLRLDRPCHSFPQRRPGFDPGSGQVWFVVDKVTLGQVFSEYFGFPCQSSFHQLLHNHPHLSSVAGTIGQKWPQYKGLSPTPLAIKKVR